MKQVKFPVLFGALVIFAAALMIGIFIGKGAAKNTMYVFEESTVAPEDTASLDGETAPEETNGSSETEALREKVDINTATVQELDALPGIGEVMAQRIVDYRLENGPFLSIEELMEVSGIGEKKFEKIKDYVTVR